MKKRDVKIPGVDIPRKMTRIKVPEAAKRVGLSEGTVSFRVKK